MADDVDPEYNEADALAYEQRYGIKLGYGRLASKMDAGFARVERKLDQFIDVQLRTNALVERRLTRRRPGGGGRR